MTTRRSFFSRAAAVVAALALAPEIAFNRKLSFANAALSQQIQPRTGWFVGDLPDMPKAAAPGDIYQCVRSGYLAIRTETGWEVINPLNQK